MTLRPLAMGLSVAALVTGAVFAGSIRVALPAAPPTQAAIRDRHEHVQEIVDLVHQRSFEQARVLINEMITDPLTDHDVVHGHRMLAMVARKEGNVEEARRALDEALAALDARPELESLFPWTRPMIIMDQADLAAFGTGDREEAIRLYDQVLARRDAATPRDCWIAAQNAAMFTAQAGRYAEATRRVDDMLASTPPGVIPEVDLIAVRAAQSNWPAQAGDLPGAYERSLAFWNEYKDRDDAAVLRVGVRLAQWHPVPQQCETRLAIARMLLNKINALRANPSSNPAAPSELQLDDLETQTLTIIANSEGCADGALIAWARMRLGLPPHQP